MKEVNVLGTVYTVEFKAEEEDEKLEDTNGYCDITSKRIVIRKVIRERKTIENLEVHYKNTVRHELVHAFIHESGLNVNSDWATNEEFVSWVALQFDKLQKAFEEVEE